MPITVVNATRTALAVLVFPYNPEGQEWLTLALPPLGGSASFALPPPFDLFGTYEVGGISYTTNHVTPAISTAWTISASGSGASQTVVLAEGSTPTVGQISVSNLASFGVVVHFQSHGADYAAQSVFAGATFIVQPSTSVWLTAGTSTPVKVEDGQIAVITGSDAAPVITVE